MNKRRVALVMALLMLTTAANAAVFPELATLLAVYQGGNPLKLTLSADITAWAAVGSGTLSVLQEVLENAYADVWLSRDTTAASITQGEDTLMGIRLDSLADGREVMTITPGGLAYIADAGEMVPGFLMDSPTTHSPMNALEWLAILNGVRQTLPDILAPLDDYGKLLKRSTSIKNVGSSTSQLEYSLSAEEWNALWPFVLFQLEQSTPFAQSIGTTLHQRVLTFLGTITFESNCTLKRYLDAQGMDLGWQFTGRVGQTGSAVRKVTLYGGINDDKGLYLSLKLPSVNGKENLTLQTGFTWKERAGTSTLSGDFNLRTVRGQDSVTEKLSVALKSAGTTPHITGRIQWNGSTAGATKSKYGVTVEPDLYLDAQSVSGTLAVSAQNEGTSSFEGILTATLSPGALPEPPVALRTVDVASLTDLERDSERTTLANLLSLPLWAYAMKLPEQQRRSLLHDLSRDVRTQGDTIPVMDLPELEPPASAAEAYIVDVED